jgi:hypothetical protein
MVRLAMLVLMPTCGLGLPKDQKAVVFTCTVDLLISTTLFVLWALAFAVDNKSII